ncbi:MAG TPA: hypothetical protein VL283_04895 [Candidatus Baltobacteraceae bacterium]|nr:hypothetical protein [Candidatus Baltobacteraceae bacterium]
MKGTIVFDFDDTLADTARFKKVLDVSRMREFIFKDAAAVLKRLKGEGWELALLTVGDQGWQAWKVAGSGLLPYFDHILYTAEPKATRLEEILAWTPPLVFVNDNGAEIDALREVLPQSRMIALRGPKALPTCADVVVCGSLEEVYNSIAMG